MEKEGLACPQCAGVFHPEDEGAFATCPFCGSRLHLGADERVAHEILMPSLREEEVPERLGRWLAEREVTAKPKEITNRLLWFPFWFLPDGALFAASPLLASDLGGFRLPPGDRKAFSEDLTRSAEVVPATVIAESLPVPDAAGAEACLLHLPFREVRFRLFAREYRIWLDAASGQTLAFDLPPTSERRLDVTYSILVAGLFALVLWGVRSLFGHGRGLVFGLALLAASGPIFWLAVKKAMSLSDEA